MEAVNFTCCEKSCPLTKPECEKGIEYRSRYGKVLEETPANGEPDINRRILRNLRALGRTIRALSEGRASQKRILRLILESGGVTQYDLTRRIGVKPGSASEVLGKLEAAGFIRRNPNASDRRTYDIDLTPRGIEEAEKLQCATRKRRADMFSALTDEEKKTLLTLLEKLSEDWRIRYEDAEK